MKFLCLIFAEQLLEQLADVDARRHLADYAELTRGLRESGSLVDCNRLRPPTTAVTVRVRDGSVSATDGPFAETKEQLGGYYLIDAEDVQEAIAIAARIPGARTGCVEVRAIATDDATLNAIGHAAPGSRRAPG